MSEARRPVLSRSEWLEISHEDRGLRYGRVEDLPTHPALMTSPFTKVLPIRQGSSDKREGIEHQGTRFSRATSDLSQCVSHARRKPFSDSMNDKQRCSPPREATIDLLEALRSTELEARAANVRRRLDDRATRVMSKPQQLARLRSRAKLPTSIAFGRTGTNEQRSYMEEVRTGPPEDSMRRESSSLWSPLGSLSSDRSMFHQTSRYHHTPQLSNEEASVHSNMGDDVAPLLGGPRRNTGRRMLGTLSLNHRVRRVSSTGHKRSASVVKTKAKKTMDVRRDENTVSS